MMKENLKKENGFTAVDAVIAMMVVVIFVTIMSSVMYSVYISQTEAKRTAVALNYAVDIFEHIGEMDYSEVAGDTVLKDMSNLTVTDVTSTSQGTRGNIGNYKVNLQVSKQFDDIKLVTLKIDYQITPKRMESIELQRLKIDET